MPRVRMRHPITLLPALPTLKPHLVHPPSSPQRPSAPLKPFFFAIRFVPPLQIRPPSLQPRGVTRCSSPQVSRKRRHAQPLSFAFERASDRVRLRCSRRGVIPNPDKSRCCFPRGSPRRRNRRRRSRSRFDRRHRSVALARHDCRFLLFVSSPNELGRRIPRGRGPEREEETLQTSTGSTIERTNDRRSRRRASASKVSRSRQSCIEEGETA